MQDSRIELISRRVASRITASPAATSVAPIEQIISTVREALRSHITTETQIEQEAKKLLESTLRQMPADVDRHKMLFMIKKRLAEQKGFPL